MTRYHTITNRKLNLVLTLYCNLLTLHFSPKNHLIIKQTDNFVPPIFLEWLNYPNQLLISFDRYYNSKVLSFYNKKINLIMTKVICYRIFWRCCIQPKNDKTSSILMHTFQWLCCKL